MHVINVLKKPLITEKSIQDAKLGKFTFIVEIDKDKSTIRKAVEEQFGVHVIGVATSITKGQSKRSGKKRIERLATVSKKATVLLKKGEKIDLFDVQS